MPFNPNIIEKKCRFKKNLGTVETCEIFPGVDIEFYKTLDEMDLVFEDLNLHPVEFHNRVKETILI